MRGWVYVEVTVAVDGVIWRYEVQNLSRVDRAWSAERTLEAFEQVDAVGVRAMGEALASRGAVIARARVEKRILLR